MLHQALSVGVILLAMLICALLTPPYEAPDEPNYRLPRLLGEGQAKRLDGGEGLIAKGLVAAGDALGVVPGEVVRCGQLLEFNTHFAFGANTPEWQHRHQCRPREYLTLRAAFALTLVGVFCIAFWNQPLLLASAAFPGALFYTMPISTDALNVLINLAAGYLALRRRPFACLTVAAAALVNDRSAVALLAFAMVNAGSEVLPVFRWLLASRGGAVAGLAIGALIGFVVRRAAASVTALASLYVNVLYNSHFSTNPIRQAGALFLSSWYLGGGMSFTAFYVEYALFAVLLVALYLAPRRWFALLDDGLDQVRFIVSATVLTMAAIVTIIQPLTQARYYMFFVPAVVAAIAAALRVRPSALVLGFAGLDIAYALSAAAVS